MDYELRIFTKNYKSIVPGLNITESQPAFTGKVEYEVCPEWKPHYITKQSGKYFAHKREAIDDKSRKLEKFKKYECSSIEECNRKLLGNSAKVPAFEQVVIDKRVWQDKEAGAGVVIEISELSVIFSNQTMKWYCSNIFGPEKCIVEVLEKSGKSIDEVCGDGWDESVRLIGGYGKFLNQVLEDIDPFSGYE